MWHDPIYTKRPEKANLEGQKVDQQMPRAGGRGEGKRAASEHGTFWGDDVLKLRQCLHNLLNILKTQNYTLSMGKL